MQLWKLVFHPKRGEKNSPLDRMDQHDCSLAERAAINTKLTKLQELPVEDWPYKWSKPIQEFKELVQGDFRVFYKLMGATVVVCHVCRKVGNKAKPADIETARANLNDYLIGGK
jgi:phage-related protein